MINPRLKELAERQRRDEIPEVKIKRDISGRKNEMGLGNKEYERLETVLTQCGMNISQRLLKTPSIAGAYKGKVTRLILNSEKLSTVPSGLRELRSLEMLCLSGNSISVVPEWIGELNKLKYLNLGTNKIYALPESIGELKALARLDLRSNEISCLPEGLWKLTNLETLKLQNNVLREMGDGVKQLTKLGYFDFRWNQLKEVPIELLGKDSASFSTGNPWSDSFRELAKKKGCYLD